MPREDEGNTAKAKAYKRLPANHQKPGERSERDSPSEPSEGANPCNTLLLDF